MASSVYPQVPGSQCGPCMGPCNHTDCAVQRADAESRCRYCGERIGYGFHVYDLVETEGAFSRLVHATCYEYSVETSGTGKVKRFELRRVADPITTVKPPIVATAFYRSFDWLPDAIETAKNEPIRSGMWQVFDRMKAEVVYEQHATPAAAIPVAEAPESPADLPTPDGPAERPVSARFADNVVDAFKLSPGNESQYRDHALVLFVLEELGKINPDADRVLEEVKGRRFSNLVSSKIRRMYPVEPVNAELPNPFLPKVFEQTPDYLPTKKQLEWAGSYARDIRDRLINSGQETKLSAHYLSKHFSIETLKTILAELKAGRSVDIR